MQPFLDALGPILIVPGIRLQLLYPISGGSKLIPKLLSDISGKAVGSDPRQHRMTSGSWSSPLISKGVNSYRLLRKRQVCSPPSVSGAFFRRFFFRTDLRKQAVEICGPNLVGCRGLGDRDWGRALRDENLVKSYVRDTIRKVTGITDLLFP